MRAAREQEGWQLLLRARAGRTADPFDLGGDQSIDLSAPCIVLGGLNGAGKSRILSEIAAARVGSALHLDVHRLTNLVRDIYAKRSDIGEMLEENLSLQIEGDRRSDIERVVGRDYDSVEWFSMEMFPEDMADEALLTWNPGQDPTFPYFRVAYGGRAYDGPDMGLGEFSVHLLFYVLEQVRDQKGLTVLLDEPDAYLPPVGAGALLWRLLRLCRERDWNLVVSTHSEEMIAAAQRHDAFCLVATGADGRRTVTSSRDEPSAASTLLRRPSIETILLCEDESAAHLARALLDRGDAVLSRSVSIVWAGGEGHVRKVREHLPKPAHPDIKFVFALDGDQRGVAEGRGAWPLDYLPTSTDPDTLFRSLQVNVSRLAAEIGVEQGHLTRTLASLQGKDVHDWVNELADAFGRQNVLTRLASQWVSLNPAAAKEFADRVAGRPATSSSEAGDDSPIVKRPFLARLAGGLGRVAYGLKPRRPL
jgi:hypothetical protein